METRLGRLISGKHFPKIFLALYTASACFAAFQTDRAFCVLLGRSHLFGIVYILFAVLSFMIMSQGNGKANRGGRIYKKAVGFLTCFFIYYLSILPAWGLGCLLFDAADAVHAIGVAAIAAGSAITVLCGYLNTKAIKTPSYAIRIGQTGKEYRIALLSDIHLGAFVGVRHIERAVAKINALSPDLVVIAGDIFDIDNALLADVDALKELSKAFRRIRAKEGVYAVAGNHDPSTGNKPFRRFLKASHIKLLDNDLAILSWINLIGRSDAAGNIRKPLPGLLELCDPKKPTVIIDHNPQGIREAAEHTAELILCGHTHRGQFFPVTLLTKKAVGRRFFYGHEAFGDTHAVISSGVGFFQLPIRIGTSNEIADIHLQI